MPNASQSQMKRAALSALSVKSTPPLTAELLATMPTLSPWMRPKPMTSSPAQSGLSSKKESSSTRPSMTSWMSKGTDSRSGTVCAVSGCDGSSTAYVGGWSRHVPGT